MKEKGFSLFRIHTETAQEAITNTEKDRQRYTEWLQLQNCACAQSIRTGGEYDVACCMCDLQRQSVTASVASNLDKIKDIVTQTTVTALGLQIVTTGRPGIPATVDYELRRQTDMSTPYQPSALDRRLDRLMGIDKIRDDSDLIAVTSEYTVRVTDEYVAPPVEEDTVHILTDLTFQTKGSR